jgi:hypothetical protein
VQALAERMQRHQALELADERRVAAEREVRVDPQLERGEAKLFEPRDLALRERLVCEVGERRSLPELERLAERVGPTLLDETLESLEVELARLDANGVTGCASDDAVVAERLAE